MLEYSHCLEQSRERGDDALVVIESKHGLLFCVADGVGGMAGGGEASQSLVDMVSALSNLDHLEGPDDFEQLLRQVDENLRDEKQSGETTAIVGRASNGVVVGASVGDSQAWLYGPEFDLELTALQYAKPLLGSGQACPIGFGPMAFTSLVIGSDGLFKYTTQALIKQLAEQGRRSASNLVELVKAETGTLQDDIGVIVVQL